MCGRLNISDHKGVSWLMTQLGLSLEPEKFSPNHNVAPTAALWGATMWQHDVSLQPMPWGFVPPWAKKGQFEKPLFNARSETIWEKASFKNLIRRYRGIVFANGFYEWKRNGKERLPYYVTLKDEPAMALAAIIQEHGDGYHQICLITTAADSEMVPVHHRQPVVIQPTDLERWLKDDKKDWLKSAMKTPRTSPFKLRRVSDHVNNARNHGPDCLKPPEAPKGQVSFNF